MTSQENKFGTPPSYRKVVGGWDFPILQIESTDGNKTFVFNNYDYETMKLNFIEEFTDAGILANGNLKRYRKGFRLSVEIVFRALQQLDTTLDEFLVDMHNATKIFLTPHKDHSWSKYEVILENSFDYDYWYQKAFLGWEGVIKLRGVKRLSKIDIISQDSYFPDEPDYDV